MVFLKTIVCLKKDPVFSDENLRGIAMKRVQKFINLTLLCLALALVKNAWSAESATLAPYKFSSAEAKFLSIDAKNCPVLVQKVPKRTALDPKIAALFSLYEKAIHKEMGASAKLASAIQRDFVSVIKKSENEHCQDTLIGLQALQRTVSLRISPVEIRQLQNLQSLSRQCKALPTQTRERLLREIFNTHLGLERIPDQKTKTYQNRVLSFKAGVEATVFQPLVQAEDCAAMTDALKEILRSGSYFSKLERPEGEARVDQEGAGARAD